MADESTIAENDTVQLARGKLKSYDSVLIERDYEENEQENKELYRDDFREVKEQLEGQIRPRLNLETLRSRPWSSLVELHK